MVYILLAEGFEEAEALIPADLLRRAGLPVSLVGLNAATVAGGAGRRGSGPRPLQSLRPGEYKPWGAPS